MNVSDLRRNAFELGESGPSDAFALELGRVRLIGPRFSGVRGVVDLSRRRRRWRRAQAGPWYRCSPDGARRALAALHEVGMDDGSDDGHEDEGAKDHDGELKAHAGRPEGERGAAGAEALASKEARDPEADGREGEDQSEALYPLVEVDGGRRGYGAEKEMKDQNGQSEESYGRTGSAADLAGECTRHVCTHRRSCGGLNVGERKLGGDGSSSVRRGRRNSG